MTYWSDCLFLRLINPTWVIKNWNRIQIIGGTHNNHCSRGVPHPSTNLVQHILTTVFKRNTVFSAWFKCLKKQKKKPKLKKKVKNQWIRALRKGFNGRFSRPSVRKIWIYCFIYTSACRHDLFSCYFWLFYVFMYGNVLMSIPVW